MKKHFFVTFSSNSITNYNLNMTTKHNAIIIYKCINLTNIILRQDSY